MVQTRNMKKINNDDPLERASLSDNEKYIEELGNSRLLEKDGEPDSKYPLNNSPKMPSFHKISKELKTSSQIRRIIDIQTAYYMTLPVWGFFYWTQITSQWTMTWFYPMFAMGYTGCELSLVTIFAPTLLNVQRIRLLVMKHDIFIQALSLLGIGSWFFRYHPKTRLVVLSLGNLFFHLSFFSRISADSSNYLKSFCHTHAIYEFLSGWVLLLLVRNFGTSMNAFSPQISDGLAGWGVLAGIFVILVRIQHRKVHYTQNLSHEDIEQDNQKNENMNESSPVLYSTRSLKKHMTICSLSFGSLFALTECLFTEGSTAARWSLPTEKYITSYGILSGIPPLFSSFFITLCIILGLLAALLKAQERQRSISSSLFLFSLGWVGLILTCFVANHWISFAGTCCLAFMVANSWPSVLRDFYQISKHTSFSQGISRFLVSFSWFILNIFQVYTMCYNFVPYGYMFREKTYIVLIFCMMMLSLHYISMHFTTYNGVVASSIENDEQYKNKKTFWISFSVCAFALLCISTIYRFQYILPQNVFQNSNAEYKKLNTYKADGVFTGAVWTIHFGYDNENWLNHRRVATFIRESEIDIIGLLETDTQRPFSGNRDIPQWLSETLGMYSDYGVNSKAHNWGCALLSKYPIVWSKSFNLPSPEGENACAIHARVNINGSLIDVVVSHFGTEEFPLDRQTQSKALGKLLDNAGNETVFLGYILAKPDHPTWNNYQTIVETGRVKDIDANDQRRWCQYIFYRGMKRLAYAKIQHGELSDTEIHMGAWMLNSAAKEVCDRNREKLSALQGENFVRFPDIYFGQGIRGHFYYDGFEPRYYSLPQM